MVVNKSHPLPKTQRIFIGIQPPPYTKNPRNFSSHYLSEENVAPAQGGPHLWEGFLKTDDDVYFESAVATSTAQATVHPTIGLLPIPRKPIISTCAGTDEEPANCASECIRPMVSVIP